ncbi:MAG TPA: hypothetical protein DD637_04540 [Verrucomicrobia bacterium]|nr:hypothetical protein [Verrucomicrobiota bacterium]
MTLATLTAAAYKWYADQPTLGLVAQDEAVQWHNLLLLMGGCVMIALSVIALALVVRRYVRDIVRAQSGSKAAKRVTAVVLSACFAFGVLEGISKSGIIGYSDANAGEGWWLRDNPEDKSYVTNDYVHVSFERRIIPDEASVFVDYRPADSTNDSDWVTLVQSTFAAFPNPTNIPFANAISNSWHVYSDWTPGPSVQTNGILHADWGKSRRDAAERARGLAVGIPVQTRVALDGKSLPNQPSGKAYTARDYVQDGLVAMWDGVENAGWGLHDSAAKSWKNLTGLGGDLPTAQAYAWGADHLDADAMNVASQVCSLVSIERTALYPALTNAYARRTMTVEARQSYRARVPGGTGANWVTILGVNPNCTYYFISVRRNAAGNLENSVYDFASSGWGYCWFSVGGLPPDEPHTFTLRMTEADAATRVWMDVSYDGAKKFEGWRPTDMGSGWFRPTTWMTANWRNLRTSGNGFRGTHAAKIYCTRIYSRALTPEEVAHNARIDRLRFGEDAVATVAAEDAPASDESETETKGTNE